MSSNSSDSCSNGSISVQRDEIARQLVEAVTQCQDAPAVAGQQAEAQSEIEFIEALLNPLAELVEHCGDSGNAAYYYVLVGKESHYSQCENRLERPLELGAVFAQATKHRALAKAVRQVREALVGTTRAMRACPKSTDQDLQMERIRQALDKSHPLLSKVKDRLRQLRAQAHVRLARARVGAAEIDVWKQRQTELQAAAHALAAIGRVPDVEEDEDGNGR